MCLHLIHVNMTVYYCEVPKIFGTRNVCYNWPKIRTKRSYHSVMSQKDIDGLTNSDDPDQTVPLFAPTLIHVIHS